MAATSLEVGTDPARAAEEANLRYVDSEEPGYTRKRKGTGFAYYTPSGEHVKDDRLRERFKALVIPPMWEDVWICKNLNGHVQATGVDEKGRKQYIYHEKWREVRDRAKFGAMIPFGEALPGLRERLAQDLKLEGLPHDKLVAAVVTLLDKTLIRIGNEAYAKENKSYGLTTLRRKHIEIEGNELEFSFTGKSGKEHHISFKDKQLAEVVKASYEIPGYELFKYLDEDGNKHLVDSGDVNEYLQETTGEAFSAKDFRTWAGTVITSELLCENDCPDTDEARKEVITASIKGVAEHLGNTPAVARSSYVHPLVLERFEAGSFQDSYHEQLKKVRRRKFKHLSEAEATVLEFLKKEG